MKLLVSDYDGTVNFHGEVHKEDVEALSSFKKEGNIISRDYTFRKRYISFCLCYFRNG